jgi:hypothetical protein
MLISVVIGLTEHHSVSPCLLVLQGHDCAQSIAVHLSPETRQKVSTINNIAAHKIPSKNFDTTWHHNVDLAILDFGEVVGVVKVTARAKGREITSHSVNTH